MENTKGIAIAVVISVILSVMVSYVMISPRQGEVGPQGIQGTQGVPGDWGPQGIRGLQGLQGIPGEDGSPAFSWIAPEDIETVWSYERRPTEAVNILDDFTITEDMWYVDIIITSESLAKVTLREFQSTKNYLDWTGTPDVKQYRIYMAGPGHYDISIYVAWPVYRVDIFVKQIVPGG